MILNPRTLRCIRASSRIAEDLAEKGVIADYLVQYRRKTVRKPYERKPCRPDQQRDPVTGRCRKATRKQQPTYNRPQKLNQQRRQLSEAPLRIPTGFSKPAPISADAEWIQYNCKNEQDPVTGKRFDSSDVPDLLRLHERTCVTAPNLHNSITADHKAGRVAVIPGTHNTHLTREDFDALREGMRRRNPAYKIPGRKAQPPPPEWQLYIASDARSGPDFASVTFVDVTKALQGPRGIEYPEESIRVDLGFIPLRVEGARCSPQTVFDIIHRLAAINRILVPVAGGWKPIAGFPHNKRYWETDKAERLTRLCIQLSKELSATAY